MQTIAKTLQLADNRTITIETGKLAKQADGAVVVKMGNAMLLATVVSQKEPKEGLDFLPLYVDYQEKFAAAGKIPGSFFRREGRLGDHEVLISRLVDRAIRPLFPKGYTAETQVNIALISADEDVLPDALAALAASAALAVSPIPFAGPISEVRVARIDGQLCINPTPKALERADIDLIVGATAESILMVEGEMSEVQEEEMVAAIQFAHEAIKEHCQVQVALANAVGVSTPDPVEANPQEAPAWQEVIFRALYAKVYAVIQQGIINKRQRKEALQAIAQAYLQSLPEDQEIDPFLFGNVFREIEKKAVRALVLEEKIRLDGSSHTICP